MAPADIRRRQEALDWVRRIHDPDFVDWEAHVAWLEASPANGAAFDSAALDIEAATARLWPAPAMPPREPVRTSANDNPPPAPASRPTWRRFAPWVGTGLAAGIVAIVAIPSLVGSGVQVVRYRTAAGEQRSVLLRDGTRIALNGDTEVDLDRSGRLATLARGEALFAVTHDPAYPFTVRAGDAVFQDVGTVFDVVRAGQRSRVAVREGAVLYDPDGARLRVDAGRALRLAGGDATLSPITATGVGGWRSGRLSYAGAPIDEVAEDLARSTGRPVAVDAGARDRRFSGVIVLDRDGALLARRVSAATGLAMTPDGAGWRMALPAR